MAYPLSQIIADTTDLLHDQNFLFRSQTRVVRRINEARRQCARRTGCVRRLISGQSAFGANSQPGFITVGGMQPGAVPDNVPSTSTAVVVGAGVSLTFQTIPGVERYSYVGFVNPFAAAQHAGVQGVEDIFNLNVNWGGSIRPSLRFLPWDELQAYARAYATLVTSFPYYWSCMNDGSVGEFWLFPCRR